MAQRKTEPEKNFEIKDRYYVLRGDATPVVRTIRSRNIFWYDEKDGFEKELMFTSNQKTPFVDEFKGEPRVEHIIFRDGVLHVPKEKLVLAKLLSIYHPDKDKIYKEKDEEINAIDELSLLDLEDEASALAKEMDINMAEAIVRTEVGSAISKMSSQEIKRDLRLLARKNPKLFIELANDDNIQLRNIGIKAVEEGIISLSADQRTFKWGTNGRKLLTVPFDENPYGALALWFKTDEGIEVFQQVEKKLT